MKTGYYYVYVVWLLEELKTDATFCFGFVFVFEG